MRVSNQLSVRPSHSTNQLFNLPFLDCRLPTVLSAFSSNFLGFHSPPTTHRLTAPGYVFNSTNSPLHPRSSAPWLLCAPAPPLLRNLLSLRSSLLALLLVIAFEVAFDESPEIAIKHCVHISRFYVCAVVFYHLVGMKNIRPNLASPLNFF